MAAGKGEGDFNTNEYTINAFLAYGFEFPSQAANSMAADIQDLIERIGIPEAHEDKTKLLYKAAEIIGNKAANNYDEKSQNDYVSLVSMSNELVKPLVISDVNLKWSDTDKAFYNPLDSKIGVSNIGKNDINAKLEGFIEIRKTENGDILNVFLKASSVWYYMSYTDNLLVLYSNNDEFNEIVKSKTNVDKAKIGEYIFVPGELNEVQKFVDEFRKVYYDIDDPFVLDQPTDVVAEEPPLINETDTPANNISDDDDDGF